MVRGCESARAHKKTWFLFPTALTIGGERRLDPAQKGSAVVREEVGIEHNRKGGSHGKSKQAPGADRNRSLQCSGVGHRGTGDLWSHSTRPRGRDGEALWHLHPGL